jgi:hypothetical protein
MSQMITNPLDVLQWVLGVKKIRESLVLDTDGACIAMARDLMKGEFGKLQISTSIVDSKEKKTTKKKKKTAAAAAFQGKEVVHHGVALEDTAYRLRFGWDNPNGVMEIDGKLYASFGNRFQIYALNPTTPRDEWLPLSQSQGWIEFRLSKDGKTLERRITDPQWKMFPQLSDLVEIQVRPAGPGGQFVEHWIKEMAERFAVSLDSLLSTKDGAAPPGGPSVEPAGPPAAPAAPAENGGS